MSELDRQQIQPQPAYPGQDLFAWVPQTCAKLLARAKLTEKMHIGYLKYQGFHGNQS